MAVSFESFDSLRGGRRGLHRLRRGDDDDARGLAAGLGILGVGRSRIPSQLADGVHERRAGLGRVRLRSRSRSRLGDGGGGGLARGLRRGRRLGCGQRGQQLLQLAGPIALAVAGEAVGDDAAGGIRVVQAIQVDASQRERGVIREPVARMVLDELRVVACSGLEILQKEGDPAQVVHQLGGSEEGVRSARALGVVGGDGLEAASDIEPVVAQLAPHGVTLEDVVGRARLLVGLFGRVSLRREGDTRQQQQEEGEASAHEASRHTGINSYRCVSWAPVTRKFSVLPCPRGSTEPAECPGQILVNDADPFRLSGNHRGEHLRAIADGRAARAGAGADGVLHILAVVGRGEDGLTASLRQRPIRREPDENRPGAGARARRGWCGAAHAGAGTRARTPPGPAPTGAG